MDGSASPAKDGARALALLALGVAGLLAGCGSTPEREEPAFVREITAQNRHMEELVRAADLLGVADLYADDAVLIDAQGARTSGRDEIDAHWSSIENPVEWRLKIRAIRGSDSCAYELGTSTLVTRRDEALHTAVADFLLLWRRDADGVWRIVVDAHWPREPR